MEGFWVFMEEQVMSGIGRNERKQKNHIVCVNHNCYQNCLENSLFSGENFQIVLKQHSKSLKKLNVIN